ncbi:MAG: 4Fe-4S binding protein [Chloroflexi bacterium]|nr:4Fe-4S binding protein [Chloroflexota bacterium]
MIKGTPSSTAPVVAINLDWCKGCGLCVNICARKVLAELEDGSATVVAAERCTRCLLCEFICPDFAIQVARE